MRLVKPENTETRTLEDEVEFDGKIVKKIKFDLKHINQGWDNATHDYRPDTRSDYSGDDIEEIFSRFGYFPIVWDEDQIEHVKNLGKNYRRYTTITTDENDIEVRIVIDVPVDFENEAIVVTIFKEGN